MHILAPRRAALGSLAPSSSPRTAASARFSLASTSSTSRKQTPQEGWGGRWRSAPCRSALLDSHARLLGRPPATHGADHPNALNASCARPGRLGQPVAQCAGEQARTLGLSCNASRHNMPKIRFDELTRVPMPTCTHAPRPTASRDVAMGRHAPMQARTTEVGKS